MGKQYRLKMCVIHFLAGQRSESGVMLKKLIRFVMTLIMHSE